MTAGQSNSSSDIHVIFFSRRRDRYLVTGRAAAAVAAANVGSMNKTLVIEIVNREEHTGSAPRPFASARPEVGSSARPGQPQRIRPALVDLFRKFSPRYDSLPLVPVPARRALSRIIAAPEGVNESNCI